MVSSPKTRDLVSLPWLRRPAAMCTVATVIDDRRPSLIGRVRVRRQTSDEVQEMWVWRRLGLPVRPDDRAAWIRPGGCAWAEIGWSCMPKDACRARTATTASCAARSFTAAEGRQSSGLVGREHLL